MIYPYKCDSCAHDFDVVKSHVDMNRPEACEKCAAPATRQFTARVHIVGAKVTHAEYNPGLGCVVKNKQHLDYLCKSKGVVPVGNDYGSGEKMQKEFDEARERKFSERMDRALEE